MTETERERNEAVQAAKDFLSGYRMCVEMLGLNRYERRRIGSDLQKDLSLEILREDLLAGDEAYWQMQMYEVESLLGEMKNGREKLVLHYRYLRGMSVERAAVLLGVSRRTGYRLHERGLSMVSRLLEKRRKSEKNEKTP